MLALNTSTIENSLKIISVRNTCKGVVCCLYDLQVADLQIQTSEINSDQQKINRK